MNQIPKSEFPRPEHERKNWLNLNGEWAFRLFPAGSEAEEAAFAAHRAEYDRRITVPFSWVCPLSGVQEDVAGIGWYRRSARFEAEGRVFLCFGAVDYLSDVYVNGQHVCRHQGGYTLFEVDVTHVWQAGDNLIEVRAEDYRRDDQTFGKQGYGNIQGIWQTVWLEERPAAYIRRTRFVTKCSGEITLQADVYAPAAGKARLMARFDGQEYAADCALVAGEQTVGMRFALNNPRLWSPEEPNLYEGAVLLESAAGTDEVGCYFGVREIGAARFGGREYPWITLNGKPIYLNGTLDQAFHPDGHFTYPSDREMYLEAWRLKRLGLNMVRIHIKPEEPRKLYWMDRLGILVMGDIPCFWGNPTDAARAAYESEWPDMIARDFNHPSIFAWVMFNETWGLFTKDEKGRVYAAKTQAWVADVYRRARLADPTRLIEDNSPCNYDHVVTDVNTWHFYINGYERLREHLNRVDEGTFVGSEFNYTGGHRQSGAPLMNSECGMVWGVEGSAGDSDLAWQYRYMMNEFRLHEKMCGFVFTEFHDVVNEFNGYYRIDSSDKDWGYQDFCRGMTVADLHSADFVALDAPACETKQGGERISVQPVFSSFTDARHGQELTLSWELWHDAPDGRVQDAGGSQLVAVAGYGAMQLQPICAALPEENAVCVLSTYLQDAAGNVISRNFVAFDVHAPLKKGEMELDVCAGRHQGFAFAWQGVDGKKACFGGAGEVQFEADLTGLDPLATSSIEVCCEASSKRVLNKDRESMGAQKVDLDFMHGYLVDRGSFKNSYWMTDESRFPAQLEVLANGRKVADIRLDNDPADARGVLSWHSQPIDTLLDEAGSYGYLQKIALPSQVVADALEKGRLVLTFRVDEGGLALYGRKSGRYPIGLLLRVR